MMTDNCILKKTKHYSYVEKERPFKIKCQYIAFGIEEERCYLLHYWINSTFPLEPQMLYIIF